MVKIDIRFAKQVFAAVREGKAQQEAMVAEVNALFGKIGLPADMLAPGPNGGTVILSI